MMVQTSKLKILSRLADDDDEADKRLRNADDDGEALAALGMKSPS
jgi:hypothetical protein